MQNNWEYLVGLATIISALAAVIALYPQFKPRLQKFFGKILEVSAEEDSYLDSLIRDLEKKNAMNRWSDKFYVDVDTELLEGVSSYNVPAAFYVIHSLNRGVREQDFNNLSNIEKIDSSRGRTFHSLEGALGEAKDNAVVLIAPPGNGKTVSLRNLAIKKAHARLAEHTNILPIFINLGYYTGFKPDGTAQEFDAFLEEYFARSGYLTFLANHHWLKLLQQGRCTFFLDGIDELPRRPGEYEQRSRKIAEFVNAWPNIPFILSCRELDYNRELSFQQILIKPFDRPHIRTYLGKYFSRSVFKSVFNQLEASGGIFDLCSNPFYLDLVCYFTKLNLKIPENKTQLFNFIADQFIERECKKQGVRTTEMFKAAFKGALAELAYFVAVRRMVTTLRLEDYLQTLPESRRAEQQALLQFAIEGDLLDYNAATGDVRFIHNRFQEYFSSLYILTRYQADPAALPASAFRNVWWKETVLFVAGLEIDVNALVGMILADRDRLPRENLVDEMLWLDMSALALECLGGNLAYQQRPPAGQTLYQQVRGELLHAYQSGNTLLKAKIIYAFRHDKSPEVQKLLETALKDESSWVSERAFFILTEGQLRIPMAPREVLREYWRFFIEGRILETVRPIFKVALRSRLVLIFMPVYLLLVVLNFVAILVVAGVLYSFAYFLLYRFKFVLTSECLRCLLTICIGIFVLLYAFFKNNYPIFKRFLYIVPLCLMIRYLVFNMPSSFAVKLVMMGVGLLFYTVYVRFLARQADDEYTLESITVLVFGFSLPVPFFNYENILFDLENNPILPGLSQVAPQIRDAINASPFLKAITTPAGALDSAVKINENSRLMVYVSLALLAVALVVLFTYIWRQIRSFSRLKEYEREVRRLLAEPLEEAEKLNIIHYCLKNLPTNWSQKLFIRHVLEIMGELKFTREYKMSFLNQLAMKSARNRELRDSLYQHLEEEHNNYRRTI